ncbi:MAG: hypothetical protein GXO08_02180 [Aquificae bacterium]|nr:hypothetical protein [Aquificota bacterium]
MEFFNWRNLAALLVGALLAGLVVGVYAQIKEGKREEVARLLALGQKLVFENKTEEAAELTDRIPPPSRAYLHLLVGDSFFSRGDYGRAAGHFEGAAGAVKGVDLPLSYLSVEKEAYSLYKARKLEEALKKVQSVPDEAPNFCTARLLEAQLRYELGDASGAAGLLDRILNSCREDTVLLTAKWLLLKLSTGQR